MAEYDKEPSFSCSLVSGAMAGLSVDVSLFPLDTLKTRLQAPGGFIKAGGFSGVYNGLFSAAAGSMPGAALFFCTYDKTRHYLAAQRPDGKATGWDDSLAASCGEVMACLVRVPTENVKQKIQAGIFKTTKECVSSIVADAGPAGFYRGYLTTVAREVPFSAIQFPIFEAMKTSWSSYQGRPVESWQVGLCGSAAGAFAAAVTTPLDVTKTRLMLGAGPDGKPYKGMLSTMQRIYAEEGAAKLFSGIQPRVMWISIGGAVFLGTYDFFKRQTIDIL